MPRSRSVLALFLLLAVGASPAWAGPQDARPGEVRVVYSKQGASLRAEPAALGAVAATLPARTSVTVEEVRLPWLRVRATVAGGSQATGWIRAYETVEPSVLSQAPPPAHAYAGPGGGVTSREVSAAGRQFDSSTEKSFRTSRQDLARGYAAVDQMERDTAALDPADSIDFLMVGEIGRRGRDFLLPGRLPPTPRRPAPRKGGGLGDAAKFGGGLLKKFGGGNKDLDRLGEVAEKAAEIAATIQELQGQLQTKFTPEQEYFLGRAVAAHAIAKWGVDRDPRRRAYVKRIGDAIVRVSERVRPNFGGYHFEVLDCPQPNGVSGPGGFVLVTSGAVQACRTEDELAAFLAHELAHVTLEHGEKLLRQSGQFQSSVKTVLGGLARVADVGDQQLAGALLDLFGKAVGEMVQTSNEHAYGRAFETEADVEGTYVLFDVLYDWGAMRDVLARLGTDGHAHGGGATHASPAERAAYLEQVIARYGPFAARAGVKETRAARFEESTGRAAPPR